MVDAGESVSHKLFRDECEAIAIALLPLIFSKRPARTGPFDRASRQVGNPAAELTGCIAIVSAARRIPSILGDSRHLERFVVVVRSVAAAMTHYHRMFRRHFAE